MLKLDDETVSWVSTYCHCMTLWFHNLSCLIPVSETIMLHLPAIHKHQSPQRWSVREVACTLCMHTTQLCTLIMDYSNALMLLLMMTQGRRCQILCCMQLQSVESEGSCVCSPQVLPWELLCEGSHCLSLTAWTAASRGCCRSYNTGYTVMLSGRIAHKRLVPCLRDCRTMQGGPF